MKDHLAEMICRYLGIRITQQIWGRGGEWMDVSARGNRKRWELKCTVVGECRLSSSRAYRLQISVLHCHPNCHSLSAAEKTSSNQRFRQPRDWSTTLQPENPVQYECWGTSVEIPCTLPQYTLYKIRKLLGRNTKPTFSA